MKLSEELKAKINELKKTAQDCISKKDVDGAKKAMAEIEDTKILLEYYGAAEPPVRWLQSHLSGLSEPPRLTTGYIAFSGSNP